MPIPHWKVVGALLNRYSSLGAEMSVTARPAGFSFIDIVIRPRLTFFYNYVLRAGFLDGREGLLLHLYHANYVSWKYAAEGAGSAPMPAIPARRSLIFRSAEVCLLVRKICFLPVRCATASAEHSKCPCLELSRTELQGLLLPAGILKVLITQRGRPANLVDGDYDHRQDKLVAGLIRNNRRAG